MKPADSTHIFFLEDEGVVFHEPSQTLYHLNTSAAYIWCLLEEGLGKEQILSQLRATFGLDQEAAENYYSDSGNTFKALGILQGHENKPAARENENEIPAEYDDAQFVLECQYQLLSSRIRIRYSDHLQKSRIDPVLKHLTDADPVEPTCTIDIIKNFHGEIAFCRNRIPVLTCKKLDQLAPIAKGLVWQTAINTHEFFIDIHAGVVGDGRQCFIMPAPAGSGKSSLTLALVYHGFEYFSDEVALLHEPDFCAEPVSLATCVKDSGVKLLSGYYPDLAKLQSHRRNDGKIVRYLPPDPSTVPPQGTRRPVGAIICPEYVESGQTSLSVMNKVDTLLVLMQDCLIVNTRLDRNKVENLLAWLEKTPCYRLITTDLEKAVRSVQQLSGEYSKT